ncbi:MAG: hypothetical protein IBX40_12705 [Methanosarcinales archaeon]|nr:hypothetical protein [Methanosarcinales archaeon]
MKKTILCLVLFYCIGTGLGHVPVIAGDNERLEMATLIHDPLKSWVIYDELHKAGEAHYFQFHLQQGQKLHVSLFTPGENNFTPTLVVMGPGISSLGTIPGYIEIPGDAGVLVVKSRYPGKASYEPFTPAAHYNVMDMDMVVNETGTYYIAVYEPSLRGSYGLAIGYREEFGFMEWIRVPWDVITIHLWEGQPPGFIFAPMLAVLVIGLFFLNHIRNNLFGWIGYFAGLFYIGGSAMTMIQMLIAFSRAAPTSQVFITLFFVIVPIIAGIVIIRIATQERIDPKTRVTMTLLGIVGLFTWVGLIIGPVLAIGASVLPSAK